MPAKRRSSKRRVDPVAEASAWSCVFGSGHDFFGDAAAFSGLTEPLHVWPPDDRGEAEKAWEVALRDAWGRVGPLYLDRHDPKQDGEPWALEHLGEPPCR